MQSCVVLHIVTNFTNLFLLKITREKHNSEVYLEPSQTSNMELLKKIANGFKPFLIFPNSSILDIWLSTEYASVSIEK